MKHRRKEIALVAGGILLGATLAAPVAGAVITAQETMQQIYVDGKPAQMEAYNINVHNYCKLRDIGQAVGFAVDYDPATNAVQIRTSENTTAQAEEAHGLSFGGGYTASAYAALREAMRSGSATIVASAEERTALINAVAAIGSYPAYDASDDGDTVTVYAKHPSAYAEAAEICRSFIDGLGNQSDGDKAIAMANYVCDRLAYDANSTATPRTLFASDSELQSSIYAQSDPALTRFIKELLVPGSTVG